MNKKQQILHIDDINNKLDELVEQLNAEIDSLAVTGDIDHKKIQLFVTERVTIRRIKLIINNLIVEENNERYRQ
ncbi:MAG: hypothetical protein GTO02_01735 [Candidatus Dadabacteria bacterium]|nr:hypothetical protein [Candidatus Dadabacteria bacterium]